jgi:hypothetical protein
MPLDHYVLQVHLKNFNSSVIHEQRGRTVLGGGVQFVTREQFRATVERPSHERFENSQWCRMNSSCSSTVPTDSMSATGSNVPIRSFDEVGWRFFPTGFLFHRKGTR